MHQKVAFIDPKNGDKIYRVEHPTLGFPHTLEELLQYDVIISSDIPKEVFSQKQLENTERFVTEFGGGFIMIGGDSAFGSGRYNQTVIDRILPVEINLERDTIYQPFKPEVPETAWSHPLMQIGKPEENREIWTQKFPQLLGFNRVDRPKPGAVVLLQHPTIKTQFGPAIILAAQEVGRGRTLAFTSDTTYLWGDYFQTIWGEPINPQNPLTEQNCDARYYRQFWVNAVRWLAANKFEAEKNLLRMILPETHCPPGKELPVRVVLPEDKKGELSDPTLQVFENEREILRLKPEYESGSREYLAQVKPEKPGKFMLKFSAKLPGGKTAETAQLLICEETDREWKDVRAQPQNLANISNWSGGTRLSPETDSQEIKQLVTGRLPVRIEYRREPIWDRGWWLAAIIGLLSTEWVLRRMWGMA